MEQYCMLRGLEDTEELWYKHFRPVKLKKSIKKLEGVLDFPFDLTMELNEIRDTSYRNDSNFSHYRFYESMVSAYKPREELFVPNFSGDLTEGCRKSLDSLNYNLWYLLQTLIKIFGEIHHWQDVEFSEVWLLTISLIECAKEAFFVQFYEAESGNAI